MDPLLVELFGYAKATGTAIPFVVMWWLERQERLANAAANDQRWDKITGALQETKTALQTFGTILTSPPRTGAGK